MSAAWVRPLVMAWRRGWPAPVEAALLPAELAYRVGLALHRSLYAAGLVRGRRLACRVLAVGNLTVGGTGKTPLVEWLARRLAQGGQRVVVLSRGYGRRRGPEPWAVSVDGSAEAAGDEPLLLARRLRDVPGGVPVVVARDRGRAGAWAVARYRPDVAVLDDGFQHHRLVKDVEVVCLDARAPWGRGGLLPRGSLREPPQALRRAHLLVLTRAGAETEVGSLERELARLAPEAPLAVATYAVEGIVHLASGTRYDVASFRDRPVLAFAGIAQPERFRDTLEAGGILPRTFVAFPDHHRYRAGDLVRLRALARRAGADALLTTEKDAVRLVPPPPEVYVVPVALRLADPDGRWWGALLSRLGLAA